MVLGILILSFSNCTDDPVCPECSSGQKGSAHTSLTSSVATICVSCQFLPHLELSSQLSVAIRSKRWSLASSFSAAEDQHQHKAPEKKKKKQTMEQESVCTLHCFTWHFWINWGPLTGHFLSRLYLFLGVHVLRKQQQQRHRDWSSTYGLPSSSSSSQKAKDDQQEFQEPLRSA